MTLKVQAFAGNEGAAEFDNEKMLIALGWEVSSRRRYHFDRDEVLGLERLATLLDEVRTTRNLTWGEFARSASPRPFDPSFLMLMSLRLIRRREIGDDVFSALANLLRVDEGTLRDMFRVEEVVRPPAWLGWLRMPKLRIAAPFDTFPLPQPGFPAGASLGVGIEESRPRNAGESIFEDAGLRVSYRDSADEGLVVTLEASPGSGRKVPPNLGVSIISVEEGSVLAGPFAFERGRAECGRVTRRPWDKLVIESSENG